MVSNNTGTLVGIVAPADETPYSQGLLLLQVFALSAGQSGRQGRRGETGVAASMEAFIPCLHNAAHCATAELSQACPDQRSSGCYGEAHALVAIVKDGVVGPNEDVAQDPEGAQRRGHIQPHEPADALLLTKGPNLRPGRG